MFTSSLWVHKNMYILMPSCYKKVFLFINPVVWLADGWLDLLLVGCYVGEEGAGGF